MASLQDQLLKSGAINKGKAQRIQKQKQKQRKQKNAASDDQDSKAQVAAAQAEKKARDQALNRQREEESRVKAQQAEINQWVATQRIQAPGERSYQFVHQQRVKKLYVSESAAKDLSLGNLAIVLDAVGEYAIVKPQLADRIAAIDPEQVVLNLQPDKAKPPAVDNGEDDPYADYQVPDDLMW